MNKKELEQQEYHDTRVAYYDTFIKAWVQSRLETNKQLVTLSTLAIGLLVGIFRPSVLSSAFVPWSIACVSFVICIIARLCVFHFNTRYVLLEIQKHHKENDKSVSTKNLKKLNNEIGKKLRILTYLYAGSGIAFFIGTVSTALYIIQLYLL